MSKKSLIVTAKSFETIVKRCDINRLFNKYFFIFCNSQFKEIKDLEVDTNIIARALYSHWFGWSVIPDDLSLIDKVYPDSLYFCGVTLSDFFNANKVIGEDMLLTPKQIIDDDIDSFCI